MTSGFLYNFGLVHPLHIAMLGNDFQHFVCPSSSLGAHWILSGHIFGSLPGDPAVLQLLDHIQDPQVHALTPARISLAIGAWSLRCRPGWPTAALGPFPWQTALKSIVCRHYCLDRAKVRSCVTLYSFQISKMGPDDAYARLSQVPFVELLWVHTM